VALLAEANKFDYGALPANREGKLTSDQRQKLYLTLASRIVSSFLGIVVGIAFLVVGIIWFPKEDVISQLTMIIASLFSVLFGVWWIFQGRKTFVRSAWPLVQDVMGENLVIEQGQINKAYDEEHYRSLWHRLLDLVFGFISDDDSSSSSDLFSGAHFYLLKDHQFIVSQDGYNALNEEIEHILYFTPKSKKLLNIEPVSQ
jgi:hypothetical protein